MNRLPLDSLLAVVVGVLVAVCHFAAWTWAGYRNWRINLNPEWTRFPTAPAAQPDQPSTSPG